jgi:anti-sigma B factor antagonist
MLTITHTTQEKNIIVKPIGSIDSLTAPQFEQYLQQHVQDNLLTIDAAELSYISSAGLRILLIYAKKQHASGQKVVLKNVPMPIYSILEIAAFLSLFTIE